MRLIDADKLWLTTEYVDGKEHKYYEQFEVDNAPTIEAVSVGTLEQFIWERDLAIEQLNEIGKDLGSKMDDVETVRHVKWVIEPDATVMHCNSCGWAYEYYAGLEEEWNFCPHCGAKMDMEDEE